MTLTGALGVTGLPSAANAALSRTLSVTGLISSVNTSLSGYFTCGTSTQYNSTKEMKVYSSANTSATVVGYGVNGQIMIIPTCQLELLTLIL